MPIYEYQCEKCDKVHERIQKFSDPLMKKCPDCGGKVQKLMSLSSFKLTGTGFYSTDYKKSPQPPSEEKAPSPTKAEPAKPAATSPASGCASAGCGKSHKH